MSYCRMFDHTPKAVNTPQGQAVVCETCGALLHKPGDVVMQGDPMSELVGQIREELTRPIRDTSTLTHFEGLYQAAVPTGHKPG